MTRTNTDRYELESLADALLQIDQAWFDDQSLPAAPARLSERELNRRTKRAAGREGRGEQIGRRGMREGGR